MQTDMAELFLGMPNIQKQALIKEILNVMVGDELYPHCLKELKK